MSRPNSPDVLMNLALGVRRALVSGYHVLSETTPQNRFVMDQSVSSNQLGMSAFPIPSKRCVQKKSIRQTNPYSKYPLCLKVFIESIERPGLPV